MKNFLTVADFLSCLRARWLTCHNMASFCLAFSSFLRVKEKRFSQILHINALDSFKYIYACKDVTLSLLQRAKHFHLSITFNESVYHTYNFFDSSQNVIYWMVHIILHVLLCFSFQYLLFLSFEYSLEEIRLKSFIFVFPEVIDSKLNYALIFSTCQIYKRQKKH